MLDVPPLIDRRAFMKLMSAALALGGAACTRKPLEPLSGVDRCEQPNYWKSWQGART